MKTQYKGESRPEPELLLQALKDNLYHLSFADLSGCDAAAEKFGDTLTAICAQESRVTDLCLSNVRALDNGVVTRVLVPALVSNAKITSLDISENANISCDGAKSLLEVKSLQRIRMQNANIKLETIELVERALSERAARSDSASSDKADSKTELSASIAAPRASSKTGSSATSEAKAGKAESKTDASVDASSDRKSVV